MFPSIVSAYAVNCISEFRNDLYDLLNFQMYRVQLEL